MNGVTRVSERPPGIYKVYGHFSESKVTTKSLVFSDLVLIKLSHSISDILWWSLSPFLNCYRSSMSNYVKKIKHLDILKREWREVVENLVTR